MKAITTKEKLPKFLLVSKVAESHGYNKFLPTPWKAGEIVKVSSYEEQIPNRKYDDIFQFVKPIKESDFRMRFVKVIRKDENGKWNLVHVAGWEQFELLNNKKSAK